MANACMLQNDRVATLAQIFLCRIFYGCWRKILRQCDSLDSPGYLAIILYLVKTEWKSNTAHCDPKKGSVC